MGGAFLSRLNAVLREEKGYTYGVRMNFGPAARIADLIASGGSGRNDYGRTFCDHSRRALNRARLRLVLYALD
jgi:hypothetical protein